MSSVSERFHQDVKPADCFLGRAFQHSYFESETSLAFWLPPDDDGAKNRNSQEKRRGQDPANTPFQECFPVLCEDAAQSSDHDSCKKREPETKSLSALLRTRDQGVQDSQCQEQRWEPLFSPRDRFDFRDVTGFHISVMTKVKKGPSSTYSNWQ